MKGFPVLLAILLVSGALAVAQVCPTGYPQPLSSASTTTTAVQPTAICPVTGTAYIPATGTAYYPTTGTTYIPASTAYCPMTGTTACPSGTAIYPTGTAYLPVTGTTTYPASGGTMYCPTGSAMIPGTGVATMAGLSTICPAGSVSQETSCVMNELAALRNEVRTVRGDMLALTLESRGQMLASRMNQLIAQEMMFRQAIAANPNLPNARQTAFELNSEAEALNRDIAAFNRELGLVPVEVRPYVASRLNTFDVVYWQPTFQRFAEYRTNFPQFVTTYQPAYAANPWLQPWVTTYQTNIVSISQLPQNYASARWWTQPVVLGSTEMIPSTSCVFVPSGMPSTMGIPSGSIVYVAPSMTGTTGVIETPTVGATPGTTPTVAGTTETLNPPRNF